MSFTRRDLIKAAGVSILALGGIEGAASDEARAAKRPAPPSKHTIRLGMMRLGWPECDLQRNFDKYLGILDQASAKGVELLITPECSLDGYAVASDGTRETLRDAFAQDVKTSPYLARVAEEAKKRNMWTVFGFTEKKRDKMYNAAGLWSAQGQLAGVYHKTHLQSCDLKFDPSEGIPVFESPWGPLGIMICADRRWPETARVLRLKGARLILNPTAGMNGETNTCLMRARSWENNCFIAFTHPVTSLVTGPEGDIVVKIGEGADLLDEHGDLIVVDIDLKAADAACNNDTGNVTVRRPDLYGAITDKQIKI